MRVNVRCCCQPRKVFGTIEIPRSSREHDRVVLRKPISSKPLSNAPVAIEPEPIHTALIREMIHTERVTGEKRKELAVYSEDHPVEYWRQFETFIEGDEV